MDPVVRRCGSCTLCCKLLPVRELAKAANTRCCHQSTGRGCRVYSTPAMPRSCKLWNCRWLTGEKTADLSRPDRTGYVIDIMPDFVETLNQLTGQRTPIPVVQIWIDPARPDAWRDDNDLFTYVKRLAENERMAAIIRYGSNKGTVIIAPCLSHDGEWHLVDSGMQTATHTPADLMRAGFDMKITVRQ